MAHKSKSDTVALSCKDCKTNNYITKRNKLNMEGKLVLKKYCKVCKKKTEHKETTRLK